MGLLPPWQSGRRFCGSEPLYRVRRGIAKIAAASCSSKPRNLSLLKKAFGFGIGRPPLATGNSLSGQWSLGHGRDRTIRDGGIVTLLNEGRKEAASRKSSSDRGEVGVDHLLPTGERHVVRQGRTAGSADARVVHQDVEPAMVVHDLGDGGAALRFVRDVEDQ